MSNATTKFAICGLVAIMAVSCGESESTRAARTLYEQAESLNLQGQPTDAIAMLDSLKNAYPAETEWQRAAMKLRPTLIVNEAEQRIVAIDDSIVKLEQRYTSLLPTMKRVDDPRLVEPYRVDAATYNPDFLKTTGVQPRVDEIGQLYFVSSVNGENLKHTGFTLVCDGESVAVGPVPYDGELNYRINNSEVITYSPDQSASAAQLATDHQGGQASILLTGVKTKTIKLSPKQLQAIVNCYMFSQSIIEARQLAFEKEKLSRQIEIARSQSERLATQSE